MNSPYLVTSSQYCKWWTMQCNSFSQQVLPGGRLLLAIKQHLEQILRAFQVFLFHQQVEDVSLAFQGLLRVH